MLVGSPPTTWETLPLLPQKMSSDLASQGRETPREVDASEGREEGGAQVSGGQTQTQPERRRRERE